MTDSEGGRLRHFTPLRYPGGKGRLAPYLKEIILANDLGDGHYVEPFAGGAAIAMELLFHEYVQEVHINDLSRHVFAFWTAVLQHSEELSRLIIDTPVTLATWSRQKEIINDKKDVDDLDLGFAFFFLNRTNRSGILNGGVIGGKDQQGPWKIDARYNSKELVTRIQAISQMRSRIHLTNLDAIEFLENGRKAWPAKTLIYCDPPYYVKGRELYYHFYRHGDHLEIANLMSGLSSQRWLVSYDNVPEICSMYRRFNCLTYDIGYSARSARQGSEVMFFSPGMAMPMVAGAINETSRSELAEEIL